MQQKGDRNIHSEFYNKLTSLNEKIKLFKQVFYSRSPRYNRISLQQAEKAMKNKQKRMAERKEVEDEYQKKQQGQDGE